MMNRNRMFALLLALALALAVTMPALAETADADPVLGTFAGEPVLKSQVQEYLQSLLDNGNIEDENDYRTAIEYYMRDQVLLAKAHELGFFDFTDEELQALKTEAAAEWQTGLDSYVSYYLTEDTEDARAKLLEDAKNFYLTTYGYTQEVIEEMYVNSAAWNRLDDYLVGDYTPTEEAIRQVFEEVGEQYKLYYGDAATYEYYTYYGGANIWYRPEGYRAVTHILLMPDEALLTAYSDAQAAYEEALNGDTTTAPAEGEATAEPTEGEAPQATEEPKDLDALKAAMDEAKAAVIASKQTEIDDIYARFQGGEAFDALIAQYGEDPGMQNEATLAEGYAVHKDSIAWDRAFVEGAFSEKMLAVGDVSDPVVGANGIHIIYYKSDIPGGLIDMTDDIRAEITEYLVSVENGTKYNEALTNWMPSYEIVYDDAAITLASTPAETETAPTEPETDATTGE